MITNCDILIKHNIHEIYSFHKRKKSFLTVVAGIRHAVMPYGICKIKEGGTLKKIVEKPTYDLLINTGFYIAEPGLMKYFLSQTPICLMWACGINIKK